jgi:hypothetical protein
MIPVHGCQLFWESGAPHPARGCFSPSFLVSELSERAHRAMQWIYVPASGGITKLSGDYASSICKRLRTFAEQLSCSLKLLGFVPMHSDSQQCLLSRR